MTSSSALAVDYPVFGKELTLRASQSRSEKRRVALAMRDATIAPPFADPRLGASFIVAASAAPGQCRAEIALDPAKWAPIEGDGFNQGYRYEDDPEADGGIRWIEIREGQIAARGKGESWPCDLSAPAQTLPVTVEMRVGGRGGDRYCSAFGSSTIRTNETGHFWARNAPPPVACLDTDLTVANLNILHGLFCPPETEGCRLAERIDLLFQWIADSGCPDVVTLQEVVQLDPILNSVPLIQARLDTTCPFSYGLVFLPTLGFDEEMILTRYPVISVDQRILFRDFRKVLFARVDHPIGPVDVFTTHLASGADGAGNPCGDSCPAECVAAGATNTRECQAVQTVLFVEDRHDVSTPALLTGDFNSEPGEFEYIEITDRGWLDTHLAAGNPECVIATGVGCGGGRRDLADLESPALLVDERVDYIFLVSPTASTCTLDSPDDDDEDGTSTGPWADVPNPFAPVCGPSPDPICWPSDHNGNQADLECG